MVETVIWAPFMGSAAWLSLAVQVVEIEVGVEVVRKDHKKINTSKKSHVVGVCQTLNELVPKKKYHHDKLFTAASFLFLITTMNASNTVSFLFY